MSEDNNIKFDLKVREMLGDAQEKVPAGVWKAVRSELGAGASALWWKRAGVALAAAAVILGAVLTGTFRSHDVSEDILADASSVTEASGLTGMETNQPSEDFMVEEEEAGQTAKEPARSSATASASAPADTPEATQAPVSTVTTAMAQDPVSAPADTRTHDGGSTEDSAADKAEVIVNTAVDVPGSTSGWNALLAEDQKKDTRRTVVDLRGSFSANKNFYSAQGRGRMGSPSAVSSGIEQISESRFGIPFSVGAGVRWYLSNRFSLGTGINYSLLTRSFTGNYYAAPASGNTSVKNAEISHSLSYIGIPVNAYFDILSRDPVGLYVFAGGEAERSIANNYNIYQGGLSQTYTEAVSGLQWSAQLGFGINFRITDFLSLYADPSMKFFFNCAQPQNVRTQQPLMFNAEIGLRFDLKK